MCVINSYMVFIYDGSTFKIRKDDGEYNTSHFLMNEHRFEVVRYEELSILKLSLVPL